MPEWVHPPGGDKWFGGATIMKVTLAVAVLTAVTAMAQAANGQDAAAGEQVFKKNCLICHWIGPSPVPRIGPELNGIDGRHSGTAPGYKYSAANKNSGIVWNEVTFKDYIKDPQRKVPGTKMGFGGITDEKAIGNLWAYLKEFASDGTKK
jgi:cytochrome c